jgi:hypothetical protein
MTTATYFLLERQIERYVLDLAKLALHHLGLGNCAARSLEVVTHDGLGHVELTVRLKLTWPTRLIMGWCLVDVVERTIRQMHEVTSYRDVVLTVNVRGDL